MNLSDVKGWGTSALEYCRKDVFDVFMDIYGLAINQENSVSLDDPKNDHGETNETASCSSTHEYKIPWDADFLDKMEDRISLIRQSASKVALDDGNYTRGIKKLENAITSHHMSVREILSNPDKRLSRIYEGMASNIPIIKDMHRDNVIKENLESRLNSIRALLNELDDFSDNREKQLDEVYSESREICGALESYFIEGITLPQSVCESEGMEPLRAARMQESISQITESLDKTKAVLQAMVGERYDISCAHRSNLERLVGRVSSQYNISVQNGEYKLKKHSRAKLIAATALTSIILTGCAALTGSYLYDSVLNNPSENIAQSSGITFSDNAPSNHSDQSVPSGITRSRRDYQSAEQRFSAVYTVSTHEDAALESTVSRTEMPRKHPVSSNAAANPDDYRLLDRRFYDIPKEIKQLDLDPGEVALYIDKDTQRMQVYMRTEWVKAAEYVISTGMNSGDKRASGDHKTPETPLRIGNTYMPYFKIMEINNSNSWTFDGIRGAYGPWFMRLDCGRFSGSSYSPRGRCPIGIHGTPEMWEPDLGTAASHGCIRMYDQDVDELRNLVQIGTPVFIMPARNTSPSRDYSMNISSASQTNQNILSGNPVPVTSSGMIIKDEDPSR
ncbi:MAG: L,D-transpeptidase [Nanoarchaeota archaeon]|nr:L,D-transpeptidase [Nanoarchaeota archaeon]